MYAVIVACAILGSLPRLWKDVDGVFIALFAAAMVVNAVGMTEITSVVSETTADDRAGVSIVAYRTQGALAFWPLLLLTARRRRPVTAVLIFGGVLFVLEPFALTLRWALDPPATHGRVLRAVSCADAAHAG